MAELDNLGQLNETPQTAPDSQIPAGIISPELKLPWYKNKKLIITAILVFISALLLLLLYLNLFGRATVEVIIADQTTLQPIEGAQVTLENNSQETDGDGKTIFKNVTTGKKEITVTKQAYATLSLEEKILSGYNKLEPITIEGNGIALVVTVKNKVGQLPIVGAQVVIGENQAFSDNNGKAIINIPHIGAPTATAQITKRGFIAYTGKLNVESGSAPQLITLVLAGKNYFLSNRSGKIDLYESNLDGSEQKVILAATGNEDTNTAIYISPDSKWIAMVSTREGIRDVVGNLAPYLYMINTENNSFSKVATDPIANVIGWADNNLVYNSYQDVNGQREIKTTSLDPVSTNQITLAIFISYSGSINIVGSNIIYSQPDKTKEEFGLILASATSGAKRTILAETIYSIYQTAIDTVVFQSQDSISWYSYNLNSQELTTLSGKPANLKNLKFIASPSKSNFVYVDNRDGKNDLFIKNIQDQKLTNIGAVSEPIRWIDEKDLIFRVIRPGETADYIISTEGGEPLKIVDVVSSLY